MRRSYKFRLRPTAQQHGRLNACLRDHRELYNAALEERREAWRRCKTSISFFDQSAQLKYIRAQSDEHRQWAFASQDATLRRLDRAFDAFFRRVKSGQTPGYPRFKSADRWDSVEWPKHGKGCLWKSEHSQVYLRGIGTLKVTAHRPVEGVVRTVSVKRESRRWYLILSCDNVPAKPLPATGASVGLDMGVTVFLATSDGELVENPRHGRNGGARLARAQQVLATKQRGSNNRRAQRAVVGNRYRKIANQRRDFHHQVARRLVDAYDVIAVESLRVENMTRSASGTVDEPGTKVAQKRGLNRSIFDAGWAQFRSILTGKAEEAGRTVIAVDPRHTSQTHYMCGLRGDRDGVAFWCPHCSVSEHADVNAARNILRAGLALPAVRAA